MKQFPVLILLAAAASAADAPVSGNWQVAISIGGTEREQSCAFTQKEAELTGSCKTDRATVPISGKVEEKKVNWVLKTESSNGPLTVTFKGSLESADTIKGSVVVEEMGFEGDFTATRAK